MKKHYYDDNLYYTIRSFTSSDYLGGKYDFRIDIFRARDQQLLKTIWTKRDEEWIINKAIEIVTKQICL